jgi:hypothetical protein
MFFAPICASDLVLTIECSRRQLEKVVEDCAIEEGPKMTYIWDAKMSIYF